MAKWAVIFDDLGGMRDRRAKFGAAHRAYMGLHEDQILVGGGLKPEPEADICGGLWIVDAPTRDEVTSLVENDPYHCAKARSFRILAMAAQHQAPTGQTGCYRSEDRLAG